MGVQIHSNIKTFHCLDGVNCGDVLTSTFQNKLIESQKALASNGVEIVAFSNGHTHGTPRPFNGWSRGKNWNKSQLWTYHMVEITDTYDRFVLMAEAKLGDQGNRDHQWIDFWLKDTQTLLQQKLHQIGLPAYAGPGVTTTPAETPIRIRVDGAIDANMLPAPGVAWSIDVRTMIESFGDFDSNGFDISSDYWSGLLNATLYFYKSC